MRVLAAMSGGVDSAVAAARARRRRPRRDRRAPRAVAATRSRSAPAPAAAARSRTPATRAGRPTCIGIPFYVWDLAERFRADVVDDFVAEYAAGRTPNPCVRCNEKIKFAAVLDKALALGFDAVCTGHYARIVDGRLLPRRRRRQGPVLRARRADRRAAGRRDVPARRRRPRTTYGGRRPQRGLAVAAKPDSHDICFIADGDTAGFLAGPPGCRAGADRRPRRRAGRRARRRLRVHGRAAPRAAHRPARRRTAARATSSTSRR